MARIFGLAGKPALGRTMPNDEQQFALRIVTWGPAIESVEVVCDQSMTCPLPHMLR